MPIISYGIDGRSIANGARKVKGVLDGISRKASSVGKAIGSMFNPLSTAIAGIGAGFGVVQLAQVSDQYTNMAGQLEYLTGSTRLAEEAQADLYAMSQQTGTQVINNSKALTRFALASDQTGLSMQENISVLGYINTLMAKTGVETNEAASGMVQLGQALASGRLQGDEFRALSENVPALMAELAKSLGVTRGELKLMAGEGKLTSDVLGQAFLGMSQSVETSSGELPVTIGRMWNKVVNSTQRMWDIINDETGIMAWVAQGLDNLSSWVEQNTPTIALFFENLKQKAIESGPTIKLFFTEVGKYATEMKDLFLVMWPVVRDVLTSMANLIAQITPKITTLIGWVSSLIEKLKVAAKYTPLAAGARAAGTIAGGGSIIDAAGSFFDADNSRVEQQPTQQQSGDGGVVNINVTQKVSRSDVTNIANEMKRQNSRL